MGRKDLLNRHLNAVSALIRASAVVDFFDRTPNNMMLTGPEGDKVRARREADEGRARADLKAKWAALDALVEEILGYDPKSES